MKRFKNILFYMVGNIDNLPSLKRAVELALHNNAHLTVLGVLNRMTTYQQMLMPVNSPNNLIDLAFHDMQSQLEQLVEPVRQKGLHLKVEAFCGTPFIEIIRAVLKYQCDLVMLTAEGSGQKHPLLGSTSLRLMRKCPCPVWVIKQGPHRHFERILASVNPDPYDEEHRGVNTKIMELAASLARLEGSKLWIIHAWNVQSEEVLRRWHTHLPAADVDRIVCDTEAMHEGWLNELLAKHPLTGISHNARLSKGEPAEVITGFAAKKGIDLIVMGTVGRTGIPGFLIGNTAETVLGQVQCSVLTVKPDGFVSPVKLKEVNK